MHDPTVDVAVRELAEERAMALERKMQRAARLRPAATTTAIEERGQRPGVDGSDDTRRRQV